MEIVQINNDKKDKIPSRQFCLPAMHKCKHAEEII